LTCEYGGVALGRGRPRIKKEVGMLIDSEELKKAIELRIPKDRIDSSYNEGKNDGLCFALDEIVRLEEKEECHREDWEK